MKVSSMHIKSEKIIESDWLFSKMNFYFPYLYAYIGLSIVLIQTAKKKKWKV